MFIVLNYMNKPTTKAILKETLLSLSYCDSEKENRVKERLLAFYGLLR